MLSKITFALAFTLVAASSTLAATKQQSFQPPHDVYDARGTYLGSDPDVNVRFELRRDWDRGH